MIYFAQPTDGGPIKIGCSDDVDVRLGQLEAHYGRPLALLATIPGGRAEEAETHARFSHLRIGRTEQFRPGADLLAFLGRPVLVGMNPDVVEAMEPIAPQLSIVHLKGSDQYRAWLGAVSKKTRIPAASIVRFALEEWASNYGHPEPPEK